MPTATNEENWSARERLRRVEFLLWWRGWVGRQDLVEAFGISTGKASGDLQRYAELNPGCMVYHTSRKRYESTEKMVCRLHEPVFESAVRVFLDGGAGPADEIAGKGGDERLAVVGLPQRPVDPKIVRRIFIALLERRTVRVRLLSSKSGTAEGCDLVPGGLGWDGRQWQVRAWCGGRGSWENFPLVQMTAAEWPGAIASDLPEDEDWKAVESVKLRINPALGREQREALRAAYGLDGESLETQVRRAMKPYLLSGISVAPGNHPDLPRHFLME